MGGEKTQIAETYTPVEPETFDELTGLV